MTFTKKDAAKLWRDVFGDKEWAQDCFGTWIHRDGWSNTEFKKIRPGNTKSYDYSWNIDHIRPKSDFVNENDADFWNNFEPMHRLNNQSKADQYPHFRLADDGIRYVIYKLTNCDGYGIKKASDGNVVDWKSKQGRYYE